MNKFFLTLFLLAQTTLFTQAQELKQTKTLKVVGNTISLSNSEIELDKNGFPKQIRTFFNPDEKVSSANATKLLYENIHFHFVRKSDGKNTVLKEEGVRFFKKADKIVKWKGENQNDSLVMEVTGTLKLDGVLAYNVKVKALKDIDLKDVTMHIPINPTAANDMTGFGVTEGKRPEKVDWKWDGPFKNENGAWLGTGSSGFKYILEKGAWGNQTKGGVIIGIKGSSMLANNYTGEHQMKKDDVLYYNFKLLVKSFNTIKK